MRGLRVAERTAKGPGAPRRGRSSLSGFGPFHELPDNSKNCKHQDQIPRVDSGNRDCRNPFRGPGNKQNQRNMKHREDRHGDPKPRMMTQFSLEAMVKPTTAMLFSVGNPRSNLPSSMSSHSISPQLAIQHNTAHHGKRIFFASRMSFLMSCSRGILRSPFLFC
jgi:hypothetical protein